MRQIVKLFKQFKQDFTSSEERDPIDEQINRYLRFHQDQTIQLVSYAYSGNPSLVREALVIFNKG